MDLSRLKIFQTQKALQHRLLQTWPRNTESTTAQTPQQKENTAQFLPGTPIIERETDTELFFTAARPKSQDETDSSTSVTLEWRNLPIVRAVTQRNLAGKLVCPFSACGKQYVSVVQLCKHLLRDHHKDLSINDRKNIMGITSTPSEGSKSPSVSVSPLKTRSGGMKKKTFTVSPVQTRSKSRKIPTTDADAIKKKLLFPAKYPKL